ncbi:cytochrome P450 [Consotaella salsifontis]|uniref:Cytochrome P450 n=1 Tax=Consotaella salsifontis TaxID=1365950 RepID=A0A1T4RZF2_9HYPH|nr:cytochrome P450 [Consotaella salsifontis]SKA21353.1 Cytochrome P450 [Consotaella salsifontis]
MLDRPTLPPTITPHTRPLTILQSVRAARRNVLELIPEIAYQQPIVTGRATSRWHMIQDPAALKRIFLDNVDNYPKSQTMVRMLRPAVGDSLFTSEGEAWRWQRRAVAPVFAQRNVNALAPMMTATAERASERLDAAGGAAEMVREMLSATFDVICEVALSGREHFDGEVYAAAISRYFETVGRASLLDFLHVPDWVPRPGAIAGRGAVKTMHAMVAEAIAARRAEAPGGADDLLDHMMKAKDPETGHSMSAEDVLHNMQFFIVAGHETTALALSWSLLLLALDLDAQERAREEARAVLAGRAAGADDLSKMPFIGQVIEEAMRLYPPVGMLARDPREADVLAGRDINPGEVLFLPFYALHRHHLLWERPDRFDPDRFSPEARRKIDKYQYLPFGAGPRVCVGANFAMMQAEIILATLISRFRFDLASFALPKPVMAMTLRPDPGVRLAVTRA